MKHKLPVAMIGLGALIAILSALADFIGLGKRGGIPAIQILAAEFGILLALIGLGLRIRQQKTEPASEGGPKRLSAWVLEQPIILWVVIGFLIAYILCFIAPAIFNPEHRFQYFTDYLYPREKIGFDTRLILEHIGYWFDGTQTPTYLFPPLTTLLFTPLLLLRYPNNFYVMTVVTLISYLILNLFLPLKFVKKENRLLVYFIFAVSIFSYGLQFELETGQFYTLAMLLSLVAIYIFHTHPRYRIFAYLLFCVSVQLKVFPALFVVLFVDDWRDWKSNLKRFSALGLANLLLLFLLGFSYFQLFVSRMFGSANTFEVRFNHSVNIYVVNLAASGYGLPEGTLLEWIRAHVGLIQAALFAYVLICLLVILIRSYVHNLRGVDYSLLMVCLLAGLMLPSISHDYNLPLLAAPFALLLSSQNVRDEWWVKVVAVVLITIASFAYAVTLFPSTVRPAPLENSFPALFILLTAVTVLSFMQKPFKHEGHKVHEVFLN